MSTSNPGADYRTSHLAKGSQYDRLLQTEPFDAFMATREAALLRHLIPRLFPGGAVRYLDFACGTGRILSCVSPLCRDAYGVDVSESMLAQARAKCPGATLVKLDLTTDRCDLGPFDLITAFRFFGNAQDSLRESALGRLAALLAPGGYLVLNNHRNAWSFRNRVQPFEGARCDLQPLKLRRLLRNVGLRPVSSHGIGWWMATPRQVSEAVLRHRWTGAIDGFPPAARLLAAFSPDIVVVARKNESPTRVTVEPSMNR